MHAVSLPAGLTIRLATDADAPGMIALIGGCYAEYEGMVLELDGEDADLPAPATTFEHHDGRLWVVIDRAGAVVASAGLKPSKDVPGAMELKRLYVTRAARGQGIADFLLRHIERETLSRGARTLVLWSDTRLTNAHRFYEKHAYTRGPSTRELHDLSNSIEYFYERSLK